MPMIIARGRSRCGCRISPAIHVTQYHASLAHRTAIIATPKAAAGRGTSGTIGSHAGEVSDATRARMGSAARPAIFAIVSTMLTRLPVRTPTYLTPASAAIEITSTICPAEIVHVANGVGMVHNTRAV